jgi:hypothetical protein
MDKKITEALSVIDTAMDDARPSVPGLMPIMDIIQEEKLWLALRIVRRLLTEHQVQSLAHGSTYNGRGEARPRE